MWGLEHTAMSITAALVILFCFVVNRNRFDALGAFLTQIPFWIGSIVYFGTGVTPLYVNMSFDVLAATSLALMAHVTGRNQFAWLSLVCVGMILVDVFMGFTNVPFYLELHELFHYVALIVAAGGDYVRVFSIHPSRFIYNRSA